MKRPALLFNIKIDLLVSPKCLSSDTGNNVNLNYQVLSLINQMRVSTEKGWSHSIELVQGESTASENDCELVDFFVFFHSQKVKKYLGQWMLAAAAGLLPESLHWSSWHWLSLATGFALTKRYSPGLVWVLENSRLSLFTDLKPGAFNVTGLAHLALSRDLFPRAAEMAQRLRVCWSCKRFSSIPKTTSGDS